MKIRIKQVFASAFTNTSGGNSWLRELIEFVLIITLVVVPIRMFVAEPYIVNGLSMSPTFETGHYLIINKFWHHFKPLERGDIIVFKSPVEKRYYIKRLIALPGETISIKNQQVEITTVTGRTFILKESYASTPTYASLKYDLGDQYFVMGDNRTHSSDSRLWGPLDKSLIRGEPILQIFPLPEFGVMPGAVQ